MNIIKKDLVDKELGSLGSWFGTSRFVDAVLNEFTTMMDTSWRDLDLDMRAFSEIQPKTKFPKINVSETDSEYEVEIAISGFDKKNLSLEFRDSCLFIKASKSEDGVDEETKKYLRREISSKSFRRVIRFPSKINSAKIDSKYDDDRGLVICTLPKKTECDNEVVKINID